MKKIILSIVLSIIINYSFGQYPSWYYSIGYDTLNINNWRTLISATNSNFWDTNTGNTNTYIPKDSSTSVLFDENIWLGGYDANNNLHVSADRYYALDISLGPGPYADVYDSAFYAKYNRVWKVSRSEINYHISHYNQPGYVMPDGIENWPANGDVSNGEMNIQAPFVDVNLDGIYEPQDGEYPYFKGDQAIYFILNDKADTGLHINPVGVEVHVMVYAFQASGVINNTFFMHFDVINRGQNSYHNFIFTSNTDGDIGNCYDDYVGCDTTQNTFFSYNGDNDDDGTIWAYGTYPPAVGVKFLNKPMTSFMYYINQGPTDMDDPIYGQDYYNYMNSLWKDSTHLVHHGSGHDTIQTDSCRFAFPEYSNWTMITDSLPPHDIRAVGSTNIGDFPANSCFTVDLAYVWARDFTNPSNHASVSLLLSQLPDVQNFYNNLNADTTCAYLSGIHTPKIVKHYFDIYPNPANDIINIDTKFTNFNVKIFTVCGKTVIETKNTKTIDISKLSSGVYFIDITDGKIKDRRKLIIR